LANATVAGIARVRQCAVIVWSAQKRERKKVREAWGS
jgi:hypothetical protein